MCLFEDQQQQSGRMSEVDPGALEVRFIQAYNNNNKLIKVKTAKRH